MTKERQLAIGFWVAEMQDEYPDMSDAQALVILCNEDKITEQEVEACLSPYRDGTSILFNETN